MEVEKAKATSIATTSTKTTSTSSPSSTTTSTPTPTARFMTTTKTTTTKTTSKTTTSTIPGAAKSRAATVITTTTSATETTPATTSSTKAVTTAATTTACTDLLYKRPRSAWASARKRNNTVIDIYSDKHNSSSSNNESNYYRTELDFRNCTAVDDLKREREQFCNNDNNKNDDDDEDDEGSSEDKWDSLDEEIDAFNKSRAVELLEELKLSKRKSKKGETFSNGQLQRSKSHANFGNRLNRSTAIEEEFVIEVRDSDGDDDNDDGDDGFHKLASSHTASNTCQNNDDKFHQQGQHHQQHFKHQEHYYNQDQLLQQQQQQQQHFQQHQNKTISQDVFPLNVHVTDHDNNTRNRSLKKGAKNFEKEHHSRSFSDKGPSGKNKSQRAVDRNTTHANSYNSDHPFLELNKLNCDLFADLAQIKRNLTERCSLWNGRKSSIHDELSLSDQYQHFLPLRPNLRKVSLPPLSVNDSDSKLPLSGSDSKPKSHCVSPRKLNQSNQKKKLKDSSRTSMKGFKLNPLNMQTRLSEINVDGNVLNDNVDDDELLKINNGRRGSLKPLFRDSVENISNNNLKLNTTKLSSIFNEDDDVIRSGRASTERCSEFRTKKKFLKKFQNFYCNDNSSHDNDELKPSRIARHEDACQADNLNSSRQSKLDKSLDSERQSNNPTNSSRTTSKLKCGNDAENEHVTHIAVATERFPNTSQTDDWKAKSLAEFWHETELDLDAF